jgi:transposase
MGPHWALFTHAAAPARRSRAPLAAEPRGAQWHPLGPEDWRSLGRLARPLSVVPDLPPAISALGPRRPAAEHPRDLAQALHDEGYLDLQEAFIDGSFAPAKRGGACVGKTKRGKGSKIMAIADRQGRPVAVHVESATPHEVTLVHATLAERFLSQLPARLIGDNAYESDRLDAELARLGVELIAPHRRTRTQRTQDGRPLRRYQRRWKIERLFAWFQNFRRFVVRYERFAENFLGMLHLACCVILLRGL